MPRVKRSRRRRGGVLPLRMYPSTGGTRPVGVSGPAGRPRNPKPPSGPTQRGWGGAAAAAPEPIAGRRPGGCSAPPMSVDGGTYESWSRSSTPAAWKGAEPARRGMDGSRNGVDERRCLGGSHQGPPIPLRQRRDWTPRWRQPRPYAHRTTRRPLRLTNRGRRAVGRPAGRYHTARPRLVRPPVAVWGVASACRSLLVHCLPWQRRDRLATIPPLCGGVRPILP